MERKLNENIDLGKTQITDKIRVSSAAIFYKEWFGNRYQYETWVFSDDSNFKSRMFIWGSGSPNIKYNDKIKSITETGHRRISGVMMKKFNKP